METNGKGGRQAARCGQARALEDQRAGYTRIVLEEAVKGVQGAAVQTPICPLSARDSLWAFKTEKATTRLVTLKVILLHNDGITGARCKQTLQEAGSGIQTGEGDICKKNSGCGKKR